MRKSPWAFQCYLKEKHGDCSELIFETSDRRSRWITDFPPGKMNMSVGTSTNPEEGLMSKEMETTILEIQNNAISQGSNRNKIFIINDLYRKVVLNAVRQYEGLFRHVLKQLQETTIFPCWVISVNPKILRSLSEGIP